MCTLVVVYETLVASILDGWIADRHATMGCHAMAWGLDGDGMGWHGMRRWDGMGRAVHLVSSQVPVQSTTAAVSAPSNSMKALTKLLVSVSCVCVSYAVTDGRSRLVGVDGCSLYTRMVLAMYCIMRICLLSRCVSLLCQVWTRLAAVYEWITVCTLVVVYETLVGWMVC